MIKKHLHKNLTIALKKICVEEEGINLEHPANPAFGDYATNIALKLSGKVKKGNFLENIEWIVKNVKKNNYEEFKTPLPVGKLSTHIQRTIAAKNNIVYLKPKVYAKISGFLPGHSGHPEITSVHFCLLPLFLSSPSRLFRDKKSKHVFHFVIDLTKNLDIVVDLLYWGEDFSQVSSIFYTKENYLRNFTELKIKKVSGEGAAVPLYSSGQLDWLGAGSRISSLHQKQLFYNKIKQKSQEDLLNYQEKKSPLELAKEIVTNLPKDSLIEKAEVVKPGFINFWLAKKYLTYIASNFAKDKFDFPSYHLGSNKKIMIEFAHPNTHKLFHIGHLRNISIGESLVRIFEAVGNRIIRSNYQGDVGLHIAKCLWYIKYKITKEELEKIRKMSLHDKMTFLGKAYASGQVAYDEDENAKKQIIEINGMIYKQQGDTLPLWKETVKWSFDYFNQIYKRVYSKFDRLYPESEFAQRGVEISKLAEKKGLLKISDGALVFDGKPYGLDTRVFINSLGYPTYEGKELALAEKETTEFGELDKIIHVVTPEQTSFFKVTFKVEVLLNEKKFKNKQYHLAYEWVKLKQGKMSSRTGNVVEAEWLIDKAKEKILTRFKCDEDTAEIIAIAAVKYSFLKNNVYSQIAFDFDESISLEGNSGPYLLYTYVRTQSVLKKVTTFKRSHKSGNASIPDINKEENEVLRTFIRFPEVVEESARNFSPNLVANYLYDLTQKYNLFYQKHKILEADEETRNFRLLLTKAVGQVIKNGLYLLGIKTVEKM